MINLHYSYEKTIKLSSQAYGLGRISMLGFDNAELTRESMQVLQLDKLKVDKLLKVDKQSS